MPAALESVSRDALVLSPEDRMALAYKLLLSVEPESDEGAESAWDAEIKRRIAAYDAGESKPIPAEEVFARLRQIAPDA